MVIQGGHIVTEQGVEFMDIRIDQGLIQEIGQDLMDDVIIPAHGCYVLPGGIDVHTHMDLDVGIAHAQDDFLTGTIAAACGGTTTIVDHIGFGPAGCDLDYSIQRYHQLAQNKAVIDYSFHGVIQHVNEDILEQMAALADQGITSFKIYMTYDFKLGAEDIQRVLMQAKAQNIMIAVHAEDDAVIQQRHQFIQQGLTDPIYHARSRPSSCEADAVKQLVQLSQSVDDAPLYVVHVSNDLSMQQIVNGRQAGLQHLYAETCPQYLLLDETFYLGADGLQYILSPPLRDQKHQAKLWQHIASSAIQTIATDHCPFDYALKKAMGENDFTRCPNGLPGVETRIPLIYSEGVAKDRITIQQMVDTCATMPAKLFGLYPKKGVIREGSDADIIIIDPKIERTIHHHDLHENVDYTPYEGMTIHGYIRDVFSQGDHIVHNNQFLGQSGRGRFIPRQRYNPSMIRSRV